VETIQISGTRATHLPTVLLVEDDPDMRAYMEAWLQGEGYRVRSAGNGREALDILCDEVPCVMLVDLMMPVMDGAELRRWQQQTPAVSRVPFVLVSATHDAVSIGRALGIDDVVEKPFDEGYLLDIVASYCHRKT
jgi:CheY-like chemotaxis protein